MSRFGDARDNGIVHNTSTMPPRTRDGQTYPGGKLMRKALAKQAMRDQRYDMNGGKPHERGNSFYEHGNASRQRPGSMNPHKRS